LIIIGNILVIKTNEFSIPGGSYAIPEAGTILNGDCVGLHPLSEPTAFLELEVMICLINVRTFIYTNGINIEKLIN
jgi:hypothetical protein